MQTSVFLDQLLDPWVVFGLAAQAMFFMRFFIQWIVSERIGRSTIPTAFWWFSLAGGLMLLTYAARRHDLVFMIGQATGLAIYTRNIVLIYRERRTVAVSRPQRHSRPTPAVSG